MRVTSANQPAARRPLTATAAKATAPKAAPAAPAAAPVAPKPAKPYATGLEVDVAGHLNAAGGLDATGTVSLDRGFMERLVKHLTRKKGTFGDRDLKFDAATGTYGGTLQLKVKGMVLNLVGKVVPVIDNNQPGFKIQDIGLKIGKFTLRAPFLTNMAAKVIAKEITNSDIASTAAKGGIVRLDTTALLRDIDVLPPQLRMSDSTRFSLQMAANGDVKVNLKSNAAAPTGANTPLSDLAMTLDQAAVATLLKPLLAPDYELSGVAVDKAGFVIDGQVEIKPLSDLTNALKDLFGAIVGAKTGRNVNASHERAMIGLKLAIKLQGTQVLLTPSIGKAVPELEKTLVKAGLKPVREGNTLRFDVGALIAPYGLEAIQFAPGEIKVRAKLDVGSSRVDLQACKLEYSIVSPK